MTHKEPSTYLKRAYDKNIRCIESHLSSSASTSLPSLQRPLLIQLEEGVVVDVGVEYWCGRTRYRCRFWIYKERVNSD